MTLFSLSISEALFCLFVGLALGMIYLFLLWVTVKNLPKIKYKTLLLFSSTILRLFLFLALSIFFSNQNPWRFLLIVLGFILTRFVVLSFTKTGGYK